MKMIEEILKRVRAKVGVEEVRTGREEQGEFAVVSFRIEMEKWIRKKGRLRGEKMDKRRFNVERKASEVDD